MRHTKGPWKAEGWQSVVVNAACGSTIVACPGAGAGEGLAEMKANARLIAAAPDMLEALEEIAGLFGCNVRADPEYPLALARGVLNKHFNGE